MSLYHSGWWCLDLYQMVVALWLLISKGEDMTNRPKDEILAILREELIVSIKTKTNENKFAEFTLYKLKSMLGQATHTFHQLHEECTPFENIRIRGAYDSVPKGVELIRFNGRDYYIIAKKSIAQLDHPGETTLCVFY